MTINANKYKFFIFFFTLLFSSCSGSGIEVIELPRDSIINPSSDYIVVIGDIQVYTAHDDYNRYYEETIRWINSQVESCGNIKMVVQTGDITSNNHQSQWKRFCRTTQMLYDSVPYVSCIGNHDYSWNKKSQIESRDSTFYSKYALVNLDRSRIVAQYDNNRAENIIVEFEILSEKYYIVSLEFGTRNEVVDWANEYVSSHKGDRFILLTHEFLSRDGDRLEKGYFIQLLKTSTNSPEDIWQKLVKNNDNILCVICGHNGFYTHLFSPNAFGRDVPQILFNLQSQNNGGDGIIQLWEFPCGSDSVNVSVYNTINKSFINTSQVKFKF